MSNSQRQSGTPSGSAWTSTGRGECNDLVPVRTLPPEVLVDIFILAGRSPPSSGGLKRIVCLTHICQRWREIALNCPFLWSDISLMPPEPTQAWLERSRGVSLDVSLSARYPDGRMHEQSPLLVFSHVRRIRCLELSMRESALANLVLHPLLEQPAPVLESLFLQAVDPRWYPVVYSDAQCSVARLFAGEAPHLRRIYLANCPIGWVSPLLSNLTSLTLLGLPRQSLLLVSEVLDILHRCPHLRHLDLSDALRASQPHCTASILHLPFLSSFGLYSVSLQSFTLLKHISIPRSASTRFVWSAASTEGRFMNTLASMGCIPCGGSSVPKWVNLQVLMHNDNPDEARFGAVLSTATKDHISFFKSFDFTPPSPEEQLVSVELPLNDYTGNGVGALAAFLNMFKPSQLRKLTFEEEFRSPPGSPELWKQVGNEYACIERIDALMEGNIRPFISALTPDASTDNQLQHRQTGAVTFPSLRELEIRLINFSRRGLVDAMKRCFLSRRARGAPIQLLNISQCYEVQDTHLQALKETVGHVKCGGHCRGKDPGCDGPQYDCDCYACMERAASGS